MKLFDHATYPFLAREFVDTLMTAYMIRGMYSRVAWFAELGTKLMKDVGEPRSGPQWHAVQAILLQSRLTEAESIMERLPDGRLG